jgi:hypothetical protein
MIFKALNNIVTLKNDQSIEGGFFMELSDDNIIDFIFFCVDFEAHISLDASICKHNIESC